MKKFKSVATKKNDSKVKQSQTGTIRTMKPVKAKTNQEKKDGKRMFDPISIGFKSREVKDKIMIEKRKLTNAALTFNKYKNLKN